MSPFTTPRPLVLLAAILISGWLSVQSLNAQDVAQGKGPYAIELINKGAVIARDGEKTVFPSVVRLPEWLAPEDRADPKANYYFYYSLHHGRQIYMKWSESIEGPWTVFNLGGEFNEKQRMGVFDVDACPIRKNYKHLAAPDVHIDDDQKHFVMFFHGEQVPTTTKSGKEILRCHHGFVATSSDGLNFFDPKTAGGQPGHGPRSVTIEDVTRDIWIGPAYQRGFWHKGNLYSVSKRGLFCKAPDPKNPWAVNPNDPQAQSWIVESTPTETWTNDASKVQDVYHSPSATFFASAEFENHPNNPNPGVRIDCNDERVNHLCCSKLPNDRLEIFFYVKKDPLDRFNDTYRIVCDISDPDFENWSVARDENDQVIFDVVCTPEQIRSAVTAANPEGVYPIRHADPISMGSTCVFVDDDGQKYLFFSYVSKRLGGRAGEGQISSVKLIPRK